MEPLASIHVLQPAADPHAALDAGHAALVEIDAAIALVLSGAARRVRLTALPFAGSVAAIGLARARAAGMAFAFERAERAGVATITLGPAEPRVARA